MRRLVLLGLAALPLTLVVLCRPADVCAAPSATPAPRTAPSGESQATVGEKTRLVRALRRERSRLAGDLERYALQLDATRLQMSLMNLDLTRAQSRYDAMLTEVSRSLATMYKLRDTIDWATLVDCFALNDKGSQTDYDLFARIARQQQEALVELDAQREQIALLQDGLADLKALRIGEESSLQARLAQVRAALKAGRSDLERARKALAAARPARADVDDAATQSIPAPGIGGLFVGANHPPAGYGPTGDKLAGLASWYGPGFQGNHTANGEIYDMYAFTCASRTLPFDTWLLVTWQGRAVFVRVNDRGPMAPERILDMSYGSAQALGFAGSGVVYVRAEIWAR